MKSIDELPDLMIELIENVNTETGIPKFPKRATEIVREISSYPYKILMKVINTKIR